MSAKLYFHYGCVSSGKSTALLQVARNYEDRGLRATRRGEAVDVAATYLPVCRRCWRTGTIEATD